jgi:hypothetical protein
MAINIIRDGAAHFRRAQALAAAEIIAQPVLWSSPHATVTAMTAWLLFRAGATDGELGVWIGLGPTVAARLAGDFDDRLAMGDKLAAKARRRMEALAARMGTIVVTGITGGQRMGDVVPFPGAGFRRTCGG